MTSIVIRDFAGQIPRLDKQLLPSSNASLSQNVKLFSGALKAWFAPQKVQANARTGIVKSIWRLTKTSNPDIWLEWNNDVNVIPSSLVGDVLDRVYYTGDGVPKQTWYDLISGGSPPHPSAYKRLGVPKPAAAPTVTPSGGSASNVTRFYTYTYVTALGEEGPPATPTKGVGKSDGTWAIASMSGDLAAEYNLSKKRIYRTVVGEQGVDFFFVAEVTVATTSYNDTTAESVVALNETMKSTLWFPPPDGLTGLVGMPNGILAGFYRNDVYFCEPYRFHAWPEQYRLSVDYPIVGLGVVGTSLCILTEGTPYVASGADPAGMSLLKFDIPAPCMSKRGIVNTAAGVVYPGPDGLMVSSPSGIQNISKAYFTKDDWEKERPEQLFARVWDGRYLTFRDVDTFPLYKTGGFVFDFVEPKSAVTVLALEKYTALFTDPESGLLYAVHKDLGIVLFDRDDQNTLFYEWRSKSFLTDKPINFGAAQIDADFDAISDAQLHIVLAAAIDAANTALRATIGACPASASGIGFAVNSFEVNQLRRVLTGVNLNYPFTCAASLSNAAVATWMKAQGAAVSGSRLVPDVHDTDPRQVILQIVADGRLVFSQTVTSEDIVRLPSGYRATRWEVWLSGNLTVFSVAIAETGRELGKVA